MKVSKAIEMLTEILNRGSMPKFIDDDDALKLGIEALEAISLLREGTPGLNLSTLPGETPEEDRHADN